jgi:hypothetical protein
MRHSAKLAVTALALLALSGCAAPPVAPSATASAAQTPEIVRAARPLERLNVVIVQRYRANPTGFGSPPDARLLEFANALAGSVAERSTELWENDLKDRAVAADVRAESQAGRPASQASDQPFVPTLVVTIQPLNAQLAGQLTEGPDRRLNQTEIAAFAELFDAGGRRWTAATSIHSVTLTGLSLSETEARNRGASLARNLMESVSVALWADGYLPLGQRAAAQPNSFTIRSSVMGPDRVTIVRGGAIPASPFQKVNLIMADRRPGWSAPPAGGMAAGAAATDPLTREAGDRLYRDIETAARARLIDTFKARGIVVNVVEATMAGTLNPQLQYDPTKLDPAALTLQVSVLTGAQDLSVVDQAPGGRAVSVRSLLSISARTSPTGWSRVVSHREVNTRGLAEPAQSRPARAAIEADVATRVDALVRRLQIEGVLAGER